MMCLKMRNVTILFLLILTGCRAGPDRQEGVTSITVGSDWTMRELSWSPDGRYLAFTNETSRNQGVYVLDLETEKYYPIQEYDDRNVYEAAGPAWSPDSRSLILRYPAYTVGRAGQPVKLSPYDIVVINWGTDELPLNLLNGAYATWGTQQDEVIIIDSDVGKLGQETPIYLVNLTTGESRELAKTVGGFVFIEEALDVSSTGLLAFRTEGKLLIVDTASGEEVGEIEAANRLYSPTWSPNGEILAYVQDRANPSETEWRGVIYFSTSDGLCRSEPLDLGFIVKSIAWSPDGEQLAFTTPVPGKIYFLDLTTGNGKILFDSYQGRCQD